jgi:hypothetical protein
MGRRPALALAAALAVASGCGADDGASLPADCASSASISAALAAAPGPVRLADGTRLSDCVRRARSDAALQALGLSFTDAADRFGRELARSDTAALRLGYLVGAARAGADETNGIHDELLFRLGQVAGVGGPPVERRAAYDRGRAAGRRQG